MAANRLATLDQLVTLTDAQKEEVEVINMRWYAYRMDALARQNHGSRNTESTQRRSV